MSKRDMDTNLVPSALTQKNEFCCSYKWSSAGWTLDERLGFFETHWAFFAGFGESTHLEAWKDVVLAAFFDGSTLYFSEHIYI
jgi:hypothetical protein